MQKNVRSYLSCLPRFLTFITLLILLELFAASHFSVTVIASPSSLIIAPDKTITIVTDDSFQPRWKITWDKARVLVQHGDYQAAIEQYLSVLEEKPQIEAVKWELCKIFIITKDYERAALYLESLLELDPHRTEYLISAGNLALKSGNTDNAIQYFGQVLELHPLDPQSDEALDGMITALLMQGDEQHAIPLMEQLLSRGDTNLDLLINLASATEKAGMTDKAVFYHTDLVKKYRVSPEQLEKSARFFEKNGQQDMAASLWQRYLDDSPNYIPFNLKLAQYYQDRHEPLKALPYLIVLLEHNVDRDENLLKVAKIFLYNAGRADRALSYFEQYRREFPEGDDVSKEISDIQLIMANDLLTIVENNGAWRLWRDLAKVTPERIGIYRAMADLLESLGKKKELIEVLQIIVQHTPENNEIRARLANLLLKDQQFSRCLTIINDAEAGKGYSAALYLLRAKCLSGLGQDLQELENYQTYLNLQPDDRTTRIAAIRLAGDIGLIGKVNQLGRTVTSAGKPDLTILLPVVDALFVNCQYVTAERLLDTAIAGAGEDDLKRLLLKQAQILFHSGREFRAEKIARKLISGSPDNGTALLMLVDNALQKMDLEAAQTWLKEAEKINSNGLRTIHTEWKRALLNRRIMLSWLLGDKDVSAKQALNILKVQHKTKHEVAADIDLIIFMINNLGRQDFDGYIERTLISILKSYQPDSDGAILFRLLSKGINQGNTIDHDHGNISTKKTGTLSAQLNQALLLSRARHYQEALALIERVRAHIPESARAETMKARILFDMQLYQEAHRQYAVLGKLFPGEPFYHEQEAKIAQLIDSSSEELLAVSSLPENDSRDFVYEPTATLEPQVILNHARNLWLANKWEQAIRQYKVLFAFLNKQVELLLDELEKTTDFKRSFPEWFQKSLLLAPEDEEVLDELMTPEYFLTHRSTDIARISTNSYDVYRWWKVVKKEREAKIALNAREFYQAERRYHELYDIDAAAAEISYQDLATIYGRLGKRQKESAIYDRIKTQKRDIPALREATEKNVRQRQPHLSIDTSYNEKRGRDDYIDITQRFAGANLQFTPATYHEAGAVVGRNEYGNSGASTLAKSFFLSGRYAVLFNESLEGEVALGFEDFDTDGKSFLFYDATLRGNVDEKFNVLVSLNQHPIADTLESLAEGLYKKEFLFGATLDILPSVFLGFDFRLYDINDINDGREYNAFSSYRIFSERSSLDLSYRYLKIENSISNELLDDDSDQIDIELPYWSPGEYWKHMMSVEYRRELWPTGKMQSGTSFVSALYGFGFEKGDYFFQQLTFNISLEINRSFLVKGSFSSEWSNDYDHYGVSASLAYRW